VKKRTVAWWIWLILSAAVTAFVIYNALQTGTDSINTSDSVIGWLMPLLHMIERAVGPVDWHFWIRKAAHVTEYAVLGFTTLSFARQQAARKGRPLIAHAALYVLMVAVGDEFLQGFVERTSAVYDIVIDFGGALLGFGLATIVACIGRCRKQKGERT